MAEEQENQEEKQEEVKEEIPIQDVSGVISTGSGLRGRISLPIWVILLVIVVTVVLAGLGFVLGLKTGEKAIIQPGMDALRPKTEYLGAMFPVLDMTVDLADDDLPRYVNFSLHIELKNEGGLNECIFREAELRDRLIRFFIVRKSEELDSAPELRKLKRLIKEEMNDILTSSQVRDVYFSDLRVGYRVYVELHEEDHFLNATVKTKPVRMKSTEEGRNG